MGATSNSEGFRDSFLRNGRKTQGAEMAGKKDAKQKASPCDRTKKSKEKNKSSAGTKSAPEGSGQRTVREKQQQPLQGQAGVNLAGESKRTKMAGKKDAKLKATPCDRTEKNKEKSSGDPEKELKGNPGEQGRPKKRNSP